MRKRFFLAVIAALTLAGCDQVAAISEPTSAVEQAAPAPEPRTTFYSHGTARDGDDIQFSVRMHGFDAPENNGRAICGDANVGREAQRALRALIRDHRVDCVLVGHDEQNERMVAQCSVEGRDIGEQMVEQGLARDWPKYSGGRYREAEARAREAQRGVWSPNCPSDLWGSRDYSAPTP